jgi:hypothetical protein
MTQGIYCLAPELFDEAWEADLDWKIPADLFFRLPQWCVYVETHGEGPMGMQCAGFFALLVTDSPGTPQLRLLFDVDDTPESRRIMGHPVEEGRPEGQPRLLPFAIDHEAIDLREAVATAASHAATLLSQYWEMPAPEEVLEAARGIDVDRLAFEHLWPMVMLDRVCSPGGGVPGRRRSSLPTHQPEA